MFWCDLYAELADFDVLPGAALTQNPVTLAAAARDRLLPRHLLLAHYARRAPSLMCEVTPTVGQTMNHISLA